MTVLVTGGAGYIGSHMAYELADRGDPFIILDNLTRGIRSAVPAGAALIKGDVGNAALVARTIADHRIKSIIHFAGSIVVPDSVRDPIEYYRNNTLNSWALIKAAAEGGVEHFIFSSTAAVYGDPDRVPVTEDAPLRPMSPYGRSKLMTEAMLQDVYAAHGLAYGILRYFNVAGADPAMRTGQSMPNSTHLIKVAVQTALGLRPSMDIYGTDYPTSDGTCVRDYIHVSDLARAHAEILSHLRRGGEPAIVNCGYGRGFSVLEVIETVKRVSGIDFRANLVSRRPGDPSQIVASSDRIRRMVGWSPRFADLETIVSHALAWERKLMS